MQIAESIYIGFLLICILIVNHMGKVKALGKRKIYLRSFLIMCGNIKYLISTCIYFSVVFFIIFLAYINAVLIPEYMITDNNFIDLSGTISMLIMVISGSLANHIYKIILHIWNNHVDKKRKLFYIGENMRTWTILVISFSILAGFIHGDEISVKISYLAFANIYGKIFWIENKRYNIRKFISSFLTLPYEISVSYITLMYMAIVVCLKGKLSIELVITLCICVVIFLVGAIMVACMYQILSEADYDIDNIINK